MAFEDVFTLMREHVRYDLHPTLPTPCWSWTGNTNRNGYGEIRYWKKAERGRCDLLHLVSYRMTHGCIPEGFVIDHLCSNRRCFNPAHLEAITMYENTMRGRGPSAQNARKTHCKRGHELPTSRNSQGRRECVECRKNRLLACRARATSGELNGLFACEGSR